MRDVSHHYTTCKKQNNNATAAHLSQYVFYRAQRDKKAPKHLLLPKRWFPYLLLIYQKIPLSISVAPLSYLLPSCRGGANGVPDQQVSTRWSPVRPLLPVGYGKTISATLSAQSHLGHQICCPISGTVYPVCSTLIYTQSRGLVFITSVCRYGR